MEFAEFLKTEGNRLEAYISRFARQFGLSDDSKGDLRQEAHLAAFRALQYWRPGNGADESFPRKSAFNWCAGPMRRAMETAIKREFGQLPYGREKICDKRAEFNEAHYSVRPAYTIEESIDLRRAIVNDRKPQQIVRLIMTALSPASGADIARDARISRQAISVSNRKAKARLRAALG